MTRFNLRVLSVCGFVAAVSFGATAEAGWHWNGSSGGYMNAGYGGSYGSSGGGSWGGYGSSGGGWGGSSGGSSGGGGWHRGGHHRGWGGGSSGGSSGGYYGGSSGGSSGGYYGGSSGGSSGGYGSSGGSSGGTMSGKAMYAPSTGAEGSAVPVQPAPPVGGVPAAPPAAPPAAKPEGNQAMLKVEVPENALVYVNGLLTKSTGTQRSYVSRGLSNGFQYNYEVRAEMILAGKKVEETKSVRLQAGETREIAFGNLQMNKPETTLTLNVPAEAKVTLGGNATQGEGPVRVFSTTKLSDNKEWSDYVVQVSVERDGRNVTQEKTISLKAGDSKSLTFDFDTTKVADAR